MRDFDYKKSLGQNFLVDENVKKKIRTRRCRKYKRNAQHKCSHKYEQQK